MGKETGIPWADSTFNPWVGCVHVSPACDACYAESFDSRFGGAHWGKDAPRRFFGDKHWNEPVRWNRAAERGARGKSGRHWLVFCASLCDVLERRDDLGPHRDRLWRLINATPSLTWLLLSKRPQEIARVVPSDIRKAQNVWWGSTCESGDYLWRAEALIRNVPEAPVRFLSMEPMLSGFSISDVLQSGVGVGINWVVQGSESGEEPREMDTDWCRTTRAECSSANVPYLLKQADAGMPGISDAPPEGQAPPVSNAPYRRRDLRKSPDGLRRQHWIIERPFMDGSQSVEFPA